MAAKTLARHSTNDANLLIHLDYTPTVTNPSQVNYRAHRARTGILPSEALRKDALDMPLHHRPSVFAVVLVIASAALPARAQEPVSTGRAGYAKTGGLIRVAGLFDAAITGSQLDGAHYFTDGDQLLLLPYLHQTSGVEVSVGFRNERGAFEAGFERTRHRASFDIASGDATFNAVNLDGKAFFATRRRVQPYGLLGLALTWLTVPDGAISRTDTGDATFIGPGINTGAGVSVFLNRRVAVQIGYAYRFLWFARASGIDSGAEDLDPAVRASSGHIVVGTTVIF